MQDIPPGHEWVIDVINNIIIEVYTTTAEQERVTIRQKQAEEKLSTYQFAKGENTTIKPGDSSSLASEGGLEAHEARSEHLLERHIGKRMKSYCKK